MAQNDHQTHVSAMSWRKRAPRCRPSARRPPPELLTEHRQVVVD
jgi:hypothetical protein